jgi:hypothetical protein
MMVVINMFSLRVAFVALAQFTLVACATVPTMYFHSFSFDTLTDGPTYGQSDVEVLDYSYGSSGQFATRPSKEEREMANTFRGTNIGGMMPRGEYMYAKWRVKATCEIFEEKIDLTHRLPADLTNYGLHFAIFGPQLYVYLFPTYETKDQFRGVTVNVGRPPGRVKGKTLLELPFAQQHQIYPDLKK